MANFYNVHGREIEYAAQHHATKPGMVFRVALKEPMTLVEGDGFIINDTVDVIEFRRTTNWDCVPLGQRDRDRIADWHRRHADKDDEFFRLPWVV